MLGGTNRVAARRGVSHGCPIVNAYNQTFIKSGIRVQACRAGERNIISHLQLKSTFVKLNRQNRCYFITVDHQDV
jgi:hypothetical protein